MTISKEVTWGSIISWVLILVAATLSYGKTKSAADQAILDAFEAKSIAQRVSMDLKESENLRITQFYELKINVATMKVTVENIDKKVDQLVSQKRLVDNK